MKNQSVAEKTRKSILISTLVVLVLFCAGTAFVLYPVFSLRPDKSGMFYVERRMTLEAFADSVTAKFGREFSDKVMFLHSWRAIDLSHRVGAYKVNLGDSPWNFWKKLRTGLQSPVKITFNNLRTVDDFASAMADQLSFEKTDLLPFLTDSAQCVAKGFTTATLPAMLLSDTYEVYWSVSPENLMNKLYKNYQAFWTDSRLGKAKRLGFTPQEVATLASIVDSETADNSEKSAIARLYINRIRKGMKLQSDPTVKFAVGNPALRRILNRHLAVESPYNTYLVAGLPPGPICLPQKSTIDAVLNAPEHDYIYMCAKPDFSGTHDFAANYQDHLRNAERYRRELNKRGIK